MSRITHNKFYTAYTYLSDMFGVDISEDLFETMAYVAWRKIGNRETRMYKAVLYPEPDDSYGWSVELPCNTSIVEAVTYYDDAVKLAKISEDLGPAMVGINIEDIPAENHLANRGW